ncbi:hypothetical protein SBOR_4537 [Sclerotinia borealis F-4128]|uniref:Uncharacterized protein n=1 Tax=Sclerotinia borealis (strain F-4128) TaxID=1432307 RepID=W9CE89_SCLBF|nr:hypothetical protein SBOR_4537 [Sclerotinia borealis F-4128]
MPGVPPNAFETIKAKFKALLKGKKSKKAEAKKNADASKTDATAAPATGTTDADPAAAATAQVNADEPATTADAHAPAFADPAPAVTDPAKTGEPPSPYMIGTLVRAQSTDTEIAAPEAPKVEDPNKTEANAPIVSATAPQL